MPKGAPVKDMNLLNYCGECRRVYRTRTKAARCCPFVGGVGMCRLNEVGPCIGCGDQLFADGEKTFECAECWCKRELNHG